MSIFVDTSAWYALADASDRFHAPAKRLYTQQAARVPFITSDLVLAETFALLTAHLNRSAALTYWQTLREARIPVVPLEPADLEAAWRIVQAFPDQAFSFVDCTSFALMERLGVYDALAFDTHFLVYRFGPDRRRAFRRLPSQGGQR